jgi:hypothetical protein
MSQRVLVGMSPGKDQSMDRATAHDHQAEAALLRKNSAEPRAYSNEVRKRVEWIPKNAHVRLAEPRTAAGSPAPGLAERRTLDTTLRRPLSQTLQPPARSPRRPARLADPEMRGGTSPDRASGWL